MLCAQVIDCGQWGEVYAMDQISFFKRYLENDPAAAAHPDAPMLKLKDWPPRAHFRDRLGRHNQARPAFAGCRLVLTLPCCFSICLHARPHGIAISFVHGFL